MPVSPAAGTRARRTDQALDANRRDSGNDRNRDQAAKLAASHGDPPRSQSVPNTGNGRVTRS